MRRNLVLVHTPGAQAVEDWHEVADYARGMANDIDVYVVSNNEAYCGRIPSLAENPSFVFSPVPLQQFKPPRGRVYQGQLIPKFEQLQRLAAGRIRVPPTAILEPGMRLDPAFWGEVVLLKPAALHRSSSGEGITLCRTEQVAFRPPEDYPEGHPGREGPMLVQGFIYTGRAVANIRVLTLFGEPLYALEARSKVGLAVPEILRHMPNLIASQTIPSNMKDAKFVDDKRVLSMARKVFKAFPEVPLQAVDILRQVPTGRLYVLEINPGGNTWHFSSDHYRQHGGIAGQRLAQERREQFDAFRTAGRVLVERTRREAE